MSYTDIVLFLLPLALLAVYYLARSSPEPPNFPPGPPALPLLGNLHQIPRLKPFVRFASWGREYGQHGLLGLRLGPKQRVLVLNSWAAVRDLLDLRGAIYSSRPRVAVVDLVMPAPGDFHLAFMPYGAAWRKTRKTTVEFLQDEQVDRLLPLQDAESAQMMKELLDRPGAHHEHFLRYFGAVILASVFGARGRDFGEQSRVRQFFECQDEWAAVLDAGAIPPIDLFPWLQHVPDVLTPWRGWRARVAAVKKRQSTLYHDLLEELKTRTANDKGSGSFMAGLLRSQGENGYSDLQLEYFGGFLLEGGSDTTAVAFESFVLAIAAYPEVQRKAQDEVDRALGEDGFRLASARAMDLPYVKACFHEVLRWRPGFPLAIPHCTSRDDVYRGYQIPADTTVLMNVWAINHDPEEYDEPDAFRPERFLYHPMGLKTDRGRGSTGSEAARRSAYAFGAGRRVCAGQRMAENSMLMTMAKLLWSFDVVPRKALDTSIHSAFKDAILTGPKKFPVAFKVRGEARRRVIEEEWVRADRFLQAFE